MKPVKTLVRVTHGSHLYGTSTAASDTDIKGVHLPSGRAIVLQRAENVLTRDVVAEDGAKNTADAIDDQSYSLQKFLEMLSKGDTVATEILFAPNWAIIDSSEEWEWVRANRERFLNRGCKGFVGYCHRQAAKYGIKGSRMSAVKAILRIIADNPHGITATMKLAVLEPELRAFASAEEHADFVNIPSPNGSDLWHIKCCDRMMPMTCTIKEAHAVYSKVWENYGERARAAMTNEGIDWKAVSHAVRVARQAIELLTTGHITFPSPDATELLAIKRGEVAYSHVSTLLESLVERVNSCESALPEETSKGFVDETVLRFYREQLT